MRVFGFGQRTPTSRNGRIDHCNVGFPKHPSKTPKREGHPYIEKGIDMTVSTFIKMIVEIREKSLFTRATPGSSLVRQ